MKLAQLLPVRASLTGSNVAAASSRPSTLPSLLEFSLAQGPNPFLDLEIWGLSVMFLLTSGAGQRHQDCYFVVLQFLAHRRSGRNEVSALCIATIPSS